MAEHRDLGTWEGLGALDEVIDSIHERLDAPMAVVAGDVVVDAITCVAGGSSRVPP